MGRLFIDAFNTNRKIQFHLQYEAIESLDVDHTIYVIGQRGRLLDSGSVWSAKAELVLTPEDIPEALVFVGQSIDVTDDGLKSFGLFSPFGFFELSGTLDTETWIYTLNPVPEKVWSSWLFKGKNARRGATSTQCGIELLRGLSGGHSELRRCSG